MLSIVEQCIACVDSYVKAELIISFLKLACTFGELGASTTPMRELRGSAYIITRL